MPNTTKVMIDGYHLRDMFEAWIRKGVMDEVRMQREQERAGGAGVQESWEAVYKIWPLTRGEVAEARYRRVKEMADGSKKVARDKARLRKAGRAGGPEGIGEALAWVFAMMDTADGDLTEPPIRGAYGLLEYYRKDRKSFYAMWVPAAMKMKQVEPVEEQADEPDPAGDAIRRRLSQLNGE